MRKKSDGRSLNLTDHGDLRSACFDKFSNTALDLVIILLAALHPRYDVWVEQIEKLDEDQLIWGIITNKLYWEESRISKINERVEAMVFIPVIGSIKQSSKTFVRCDYCRKFGHLKKNCWKYQKDLKSKKNMTNSSKTQGAALFVGDISEPWSDEEEEFWQEFLYAYTAN